VGLGRQHGLRHGVLDARHSYQRFGAAAATVCVDFHGYAYPVCAPATEGSGIERESAGIAYHTVDPDGRGVRAERIGDGDGGGAAVSELCHVFEKDRGHLGEFQCTGAGGSGLPRCLRS